MCNKPSHRLYNCPVAIRAGSHPTATALVTKKSLYTYAALDAAIAARQAFLSTHGIGRGDRVLVVVSPSVSCCATLWALFRLGATACPMNPALPETALARTAAMVEAHWMVAEQTVTPLRQPSASTDAPQPASKHPALATIVLTSGSSGAPKAAVHSHENHLAAARTANRNMPLSPGDRWLLSLSLFHVAGLAVLFRCALAGAAAALPEAGLSLEDNLTTSGATHVSLVPTQLYRLLESSRAAAALRNMKGVLLGGAPVAPSLIARAWNAGLSLTRSYGMTETAAQLCATASNASYEELLSDGRPLVSNTIRIGTDGMVEVRGAALFLGYYHGNGHCRRPETADGWFRTGDMGHFDAQGRLHITGRADAMFICGGENIQPEEIEAALCALPGVRRAVVAPLPHDEYGAVPVAFVDKPQSEAWDDAALRDGLAPLLPRFKIPRYFLAWPNTLCPGMKPNRNLFAAEARKRCG